MTETGGGRDGKRPPEVCTVALRVPVMLSLVTTAAVAAIVAILTLL